MDTAAQIVDRGLKLLNQDSGEMWMELLEKSPVEDYHIIAATAVQPRDEDHYMKLFKKLVMEDETHVGIGVVWNEDQFGELHLSSEPIGGIMAFGGWYINRNYALQDELDRHVLYYWQVRIDSDSCYIQVERERVV